MYMYIKEIDRERKKERKKEIIICIIIICIIICIKWPNSISRQDEENERLFEWVDGLLDGWGVCDGENTYPLQNFVVWGCVWVLYTSTFPTVCPAQCPLFLSLLAAPTTLAGMLRAYS